MGRAKRALLLELRTRPRRLAPAVQRGAALGGVACLAVACAELPSFLRFGSETVAEAAHEGIHALLRPPPSVGAPNVDQVSGSLDPAPRPAAGAETPAHAPPNSVEMGVGFKAGEPLARIRQRLARLVRSGVLEVLFDEVATSNAPRDAYFVQIGSYQAQRAAEGQLGAARIALSSVISGFDLRVRATDLPSQGRFFRVQIGPIASQRAAADLCRSLEAKRQTCFLIAEKSSPARPSAHIDLTGGWASIGPGEPSAGQQTADRAGDAIETEVSRQVADAAPVYTVPGLPGLPD